MTHDELLAKLDELDHSCSVVGITVGALRAVVKLHKPDYKGTHWDCLMKDGDEGYPCPTIQAIEKELIPLSKSQVRRITKVKSDELREKELG
jgi:hypothetical protein